MKIFIKEVESGTYYYHAHEHYLQQYIFGAVVITNDKVDRNLFEYEEERIIMLHEYYSVNRTQAHAMMNMEEHHLLHEASKFLINGKDWNWTSIHYNGYNDIKVEPAKTYRLRIINGKQKLR